MSNITLTADQLAVKQAFIKFILDPTQSRMVIQGYAGTGKTTVTSVLIEELPNILRTAELLGQQKEIIHDVQLTATTNKAAEALAYLTKRPVSTIHSLLGLRVDTNWKTRETTLQQTRNTMDFHNTLIFIDEASYIDPKLLDLIEKLTVHSKVIFMGDPAQLAPVKFNYAPVFKAGYPTVALTDVVRQIAGNPIIDLATAFRNTVNSGQFFKFKPDGEHVVHLDRDTFERTMIKEFSRPDWKSHDSKYLAWTNKAVIAHNHAINGLIKGTPNLAVHDYAVCNKYIAKKGHRIKTDQLVQVTKIDPAQQHGVDGWNVELDHRFTAFLPKSLEKKTKRLKEATKKEQYAVVREISETWIDLRAAYACTINKSQGSTYDRVFIDLDNVGKCNNANMIARMLYVAVSRARHEVYLTGDLV